jgi:hypothetical protein
MGGNAGKGEENVGNVGIRIKFWPKKRLGRQGNAL